MVTPTDLRDFFCDDYLASSWAEHGYWDGASQLMLVVPARERLLRPELDFLAVGRPGVDGIEFGYRRGRRGVWAYYPIEREFVLVAETIADLIDGYTSSRIRL